jgi:hypothetical protein
MRLHPPVTRNSIILTLFLLAIVAFSLNLNKTSSTSEVSRARTFLALADPSSPLKTSYEPAQIKLVSTAYAASKDNSEKTFSVVYNIPVLTVRSRAVKPGPDDEGGEQTIEHTGISETIEMEYARRPDGSPFRLAISEQNPGSSGPSLQSSFWQAAVVAALHESDDLSGVRVTFSVPSDIDGPSAGGVISLALLSAINQKELPDDFAFTGSILPDGTIGHIGGIAEKLRAAKDRGASRMLIPAGMRLAEDMTTGELVDLHSLAGKYNITLIPVRNLKAAYREVHKLPEELQANSDELVAKLPKILESLLLRDCQKNLREGDVIWEKIDEETQEELVADPYALNFLLARTRAHQALLAGQFCYAFDQAAMWGEYLKAREQNVVFFKALSKLDGLGETFYLSLTNEIRRLMDDAPTPEDLLDKLATEFPPVTSQLFFDIYQTHGWLRLILQADEVLRSQLAEIAALTDNQIPEGKTKEQLVLETCFQSQPMQLLLAHFIHRHLSSYHELATQQGEALVPMAIDVDRNRIIQVERFFYAAFRSIRTTFNSEVVNSLAEESAVPESKVLDYVLEYDQSLNMSIPTYERIDQIHDALQDEEDIKESLFKATFNAHLCASKVAELSGIVVRWSELEPDVNENGELVYGKTSMLSRLIREARKNSIEKINRCYEKGIPCVSSIWMFEYAEAGRDDPNEDQVEVLLNYWKASLQAQALQMMFQAQADL